MAYIKTTWEDLPSEDTPIVSTALQNIEDGIEALDTAFSGLLNFFYPVGTIYETTSTNLDTTTKMANHFGGTWEEYGSGRVLVAKSADTEFDTIGETGGAKTVTLDTTMIPSHTHEIKLGISEGGQTGRYADYVENARLAYNTQDNKGTTATGGGLAHNNLQPYIVVYRYRRTA